MENNKERYIFTFGCGHPFAKYLQVVEGNMAASRELMVEVYGLNWAFQYSEQELQSCGLINGYEKLPTIKGGK